MVGGVGVLLGVASWTGGEPDECLALVAVEPCDCVGLSALLRCALVRARYAAVPWACCATMGFGTCTGLAWLARCAR